MKNTKLLSILAASTLFFTVSLPGYADTTDANVPTSCKDGTTSTAKGRGACSGHGGVKSAAAPTAAQSAGATPLSTTQGAPAAPAPPSAGGSTCQDGTTSAASGRGACSGHGGVQKAAKAAAPTSASAAPTAAGAPAATSQPSGTTSTSSSTATAAAKVPGTSKSGSVNTDPTGATAKCKDGTFSHSATHSGSCSHHGGVADFLTPGH